MPDKQERRITAQLAEFAAETKYEDLPAQAIAAAKRALMDHVGVTVAGSQEPVGKLVTKHQKRFEGHPVAVVAGGGYRTTSADAALANGAMAHALDYDDVGTNSSGFPVAVHLTTVLYAAIMALGEEHNASGRDILAAYVLGYEVASQTANTMSQDFGDDLGWHPTSVLGAIGASVACARLLNLDSQKTTVALSIAASFASGIRQNFGTMTKSIQVGNSARSGIVSAQMAADNFTAAMGALEGRYGYCHAFSGGKGWDIGNVSRKLGETYQVVLPGPAVKLYPCCASAHGPLNILFSLVSKHDIHAEMVAGIDVIVPFDPPRSLIYDNPQNAMEGKFSLQYLLAAALIDKKIGLDTFTDEKLHRPQAVKMFKQISMYRQPGMEGKPSWVPPEYVVNIKMVDGRTYSEGAKAPFIAPVRVPTWQEMSQKYHDCTRLVLSEKDIEKSLWLLNDLEKLESIKELADIMVKQKVS